MLVQLLCDGPLRRVVGEMLTSRGFALAENARIAFVQKGLPLPEQGIAVVFTYESLDELLDFLDALPGRPEQGKNVIVGWREDSESYGIVALEDIFYFEAEGNYTYCVTRAGRLRVKTKLYELEEHPPDTGFIRISKSVIVNILHVENIIPWFGSRLLLKFKSGQELEISRNYTKRFKEFLEI